jgi:hypothetical protein
VSCRDVGEEVHPSEIPDGRRLDTVLLYGLVEVHQALLYQGANHRRDHRFTEALRPVFRGRAVGSIVLVVDQHAIFCHCEAVAMRHTGAEQRTSLGQSLYVKPVFLRRGVSPGTFRTKFK